MRIAYTTEMGACIQGTAEKVMASLDRKVDLAGGADLIFTSPPFPLNNKKKYGNLQGEKYVAWLSGFGPLFKKLLKPKGSIIIEVGNAWEPGRPVMSTLALRALLAFLEAGKFSLCQQFVWNNPARLPSPAEWVTVQRIRLKDAFTHLWWMSPSDRPKADNRRVLQGYSKAMLDLLKSRKYNSGKRPSEHAIGSTSFLTNNGGAIPSNVVTLANTANTGVNGAYLDYCRAKNLILHPARMPSGLADFFIKFLTRPGDLVLDPFAGSNTTGAAAEALGRHWVAIELQKDYVRGSRGRFRQRSAARRNHAAQANQ